MAFVGMENGELFIENVCHQPFQSMTPTFIPRFYNDFVIKTAISRKDMKEQTHLCLYNQNHWPKKWLSAFLSLLPPKEVSSQMPTFCIASRSGDGHDFTHGLHLSAQGSLHRGELVDIPTWNLSQTCDQHGLPRVVSPGFNPSKPSLRSSPRKVRNKRWCTV